jgi:hypothetical protein
MLALSCGDVAGMWMVLSPRTIPFSACILAAALASRVVTGGEGLPGAIGSGLEVVGAVLLPAALITEVVKFATCMQGGETGTGGRF